MKVRSKFKPGALFLLAASFLATYVQALDPFGQQPGLAPAKEFEGDILRVRVIHTRDAALPGGSAYLVFTDPWLGYVRGRELFLREFSARDGVFGETRGVPQPVLEDGITPMIRGARAASCALCHNSPFGDGGAGPTISKNGISGRNTPHLFGAGLIEMIGAALRARLLEQGDTNRNGFIDLSEAVNRAARAIPVSGGVPLSYGNFGDLDADGIPDLNPLCYVWYVDAAGKRLPRARSLSDPGVAGYSFEVQVFGWGHAAFGNRPPISSTLRGFSAAAFHVHAGMQAFDATLNGEPARDGLCGVSILGAQQFFTGRTLDRGRQMDACGLSADDPDRDGIPEELTEGDMDLLEFYLLNHPAPAELERSTTRERGRELFTEIGCAVCHVPDWEVPADRRSFNLSVSFNTKSARLEGRLEDLVFRKGGEARPAAKPTRVRGVYSDFAYHDLGAAFHQKQFNGSVITQFRTAPLWGVGSSAPYGHDGRSLDLESVIRRHGGAAAESTARFAALGADDRGRVLAFLNGLVLYEIDVLPCDVDGDGAIAPDERLNPMRMMRNTDFGVNLEYLKDVNRNGVPDIRER